MHLYGPTRRSQCGGRFFWLRALRGFAVQQASRGDAQQDERPAAKDQVDSHEESENPTGRAWPLRPDEDSEAQGDRSGEDQPPGSGLTPKLEECDELEDPLGRESRGAGFVSNEDSGVAAEKGGRGWNVEVRGPDGHCGPQAAKAPGREPPPRGAGADQVRDPPFAQGSRAL